MPTHRNSPPSGFGGRRRNHLGLALPGRGAPAVPILARSTRVRKRLPLGDDIRSLATEIMRRRSRLTKKVGGHLKEFGPRQDFLNILKDSRLAKSSGEEIEMLWSMARKLDSTAASKPNFQNRLKEALKGHGLV